MPTESDTQIHRPAIMTPWRVVYVEPLPSYCLFVGFADGIYGKVNLERLICGSDAGVFVSLRDPNKFFEVAVKYGAVTWPGGLDLAPDAMHDAMKRNPLWVIEPSFLNV